MLPTVPGVVCVAGHGCPPLVGGVHEVPCTARRVPQLLRQPVPRLPQVLSRQETHTQVGGTDVMCTSAVYQILPEKLLI